MTEAHPRRQGPSEWLDHPVGAGPWEVEHPDQPRPQGSHWDEELLTHGDRRNVLDRYRYWTVEAIRADIDQRRHEGLHVAIENFEHDMNIGTIVRTANAFAAAEVHIIGRKRWNRSGAMMTDRYQHLRLHPSTADFIAYAREHDLPLVGVDNVPGSVPVETATLPARCVLVCGQEGPGLTPAMQAAAEVTVSIAQFGSTRSINAGVAAGIVMHTWIRQHGRLDQRC